MSSHEVTVIVPTYRRPEDLARCLAGLANQLRPADEILVVRRVDDFQSAEVLSGASTLRASEVVVAEAGVVAALAAGLRRSRGDIIAFTDDDAVPHSDWLQRIVRRFEESRITGAVGGKDLVTEPEQSFSRHPSMVGYITKWGRVIGNHHLGNGLPRPVSVLKGVNMAFRSEALAIPMGLKGEGAQAHWEIACCLWAGRNGWKILYDPQVLVDHRAAPRPSGDARSGATWSVVQNNSFNLAFSLLSFRQDLRFRRMIFGFLLGTRGDMGIGRAIVALVQGQVRLAGEALPSIAGKAQAHIALIHSSLQMTTVSNLRNRSGILAAS